MIGVVRVIAALALSIAASVAAAQESFWIQIEARPGRAQAEARAADWDSRLDNVASFNTGGRWNAIVVGPFTEVLIITKLLSFNNTTITKLKSMRC